MSCIIISCRRQREHDGAPGSALALAFASGSSSLPVSLKILVGTMTGTAELVAEEISDVLTEAGHEVEVEPMDDLGADVFAGGVVILVLGINSTLDLRQIYDRFLI